ncbi:hypothetical protein ACS0TY_014609 [Phlomoides rotata]
MELGDWIMVEIHHLSREDGTLLAILLWLAWYARDEKVFGDRVVTGKMIRATTFWHLTNFQAAQLQSSHVREDSQPMKWTPPPAVSIKLNVDATFRIGVGVGLGGVMRDEFGTVIWAWAFKKETSFTFEVAEAMAVREGNS